MAPVARYSSMYSRTAGGEPARATPPRRLGWGRPACWSKRSSSASMSRRSSRVGNPVGRSPTKPNEPSLVDMNWLSPRFSASSRRGAARFQRYFSQAGVAILIASSSVSATTRWTTRPIIGASPCTVRAPTP